MGASKILDGALAEQRHHYSDLDPDSRWHVPVPPVGDVVHLHGRRKAYIVVDIVGDLLEIREEQDSPLAPTLKLRAKDLELRP